MARSKQNKQKQQAAKNAAAKMKKSFGVKDIDDLMEQMDKEDAKQDADDSSVHGGGRKKIPKEDLSDDEEDTEEEDAIEEEYEKAVDAIMNANIEDSTKHGYRLNLVRLVKFLYSKKSKASSKKNKTNIASFSELLHDDLLSDMNAVVAKKGSEKEMKDVIQKHLLKANAEYHPIDLPKLDVPTFIGHLLALTNKNSDGDSVKQEEGPDGKKEKEKQAFLKSYGGHRSALTFLFNECEITPSAQFQAKMSKAMAGLKNTAAKRRGQDGGKLGEGKLPLPFDVYCAIQTILEHTPLSNNVTWIFAKTPVQGGGTNDCGVCTYSFPTLYLRGLEKQGLLSTVEKDQNRQPAPYIQNVELQLPSTMNTFTFGATARRHMKRSLRHGVLDTKSPMFDCEVVWS
jgi:hypothetical protein